MNVRAGAVRWLATLGVVAVDAAWLDSTHRSIANAGAWVLLLAFTIMLILFVSAFGMALLMGIDRFRQFREAAARDLGRRVLTTLNYVLLMFIFIQAIVVLTYLAATLDVPVIDARLAAADGRLGFDWPRLFAWVQAHAPIQAVLGGAYETLGLQALLIPVFLGLTGKSRHLNELSSHLIVAFLLMLLVSIPFPAHCAFKHYGLGSADSLAMLSDFEALRDGTMRVFDVGQLQGLVCFPSMHTAMAILLTYSLRGSIRLLSVAVALNAVLIMSTPTQGGHYLVDTLAGVLLGATTILLVRALPQSA